MTSGKSPFRKSDNLRIIAERIVAETLRAADPGRLIRDQVALAGNRVSVQGRAFPLRPVRRIHVLGAGKAAPFLYGGLREVLDDRIFGGVIASIPQHGFTEKRVSFAAGTHPIPDRKSVSAARRIIAYIAREVREPDLVFFLLGGGASALIALPLAPATLADKISLTQNLMMAGATIGEINCVRKHLSAVKGGRLAALIRPAKTVSLILSDIVGSPLDQIGSGPTVADPSTFAQAHAVLEKYRLLGRLRPRLREFLEPGPSTMRFETPKPGSPELSRSYPFLVGDNRLVLQKATELARLQGLRPRILNTGDEGEASTAARIYAGIIKKEILCRSAGTASPLLLSGGEFTVTVRGKGKGGRNQEFILALLGELREIRHPFHVLSVGTDGIDGPTDAAGAWIDEQSASRAQRLGLDIDDHLARNDSYHFFRKMNQLIVTGPTRTNVMDLRMFFIG